MCVCVCVCVAFHGGARQAAIVGQWSEIQVMRL